MDFRPPSSAASHDIYCTSDKCKEVIHSNSHRARTFMQFRSYAPMWLLTTHLTNTRVPMFKGRTLLQRDDVQRGQDDGAGCDRQDVPRPRWHDSGDLWLWMVARVERRVRPQLDRRVRAGALWGLFHFKNCRNSTNPPVPRVSLSC